MTTETLTRIESEEKNLDKQSFIRPNKREKLLMKINAFKINNLNARGRADYDMLVKKTSAIFIHLCWSKFGVSAEQLRKLEQQDLNELAAIIYGESRLWSLIQSGILACIPIVGWSILGVTLHDVSQTPESDISFYKNMRYHWWCRRIKNKYNQSFKPDLNSVSK